MVVGDDLFLDTGIDSLPNEDETGSGGAVDPNRDNFLENGGPEGDGRFQEGEPLGDRGHRFLLHPRLGLPTRLFDLVELYPEVGWHETLYTTRAQDFEDRGFLTTRLDMRTRLSRDFGAFRHVVEPRLGYAGILKGSQSSNPIFVPPTAVPQTRIRELALDNLTLDPADRIDDRQAITLGFNNRFYGSGEGGPELLGDIAFQASYDAVADEFGEIFIDGRAYPFASSTARFNLGFDPGGGQAVRDPGGPRLAPERRARAALLLPLPAPDPALLRGLQRRRPLRQLRE